MHSLWPARKTLPRGLSHQTPAPPALSLGTELVGAGDDVPTLEQLHNETAVFTPGPVLPKIEEMLHDLGGDVDPAGRIPSKRPSNAAILLNLWGLFAVPRQRQRQVLFVEPFSTRTDRLNEGDPGTP